MFILRLILNYIASGLLFASSGTGSTIKMDMVGLTNSDWQKECQFAASGVFATSLGGLGRTMKAIEPSASMIATLINTALYLS